MRCGEKMALYKWAVKGQLLSDCIADKSKCLCQKITVGVCMSVIFFPFDLMCLSLWKISFHITEIVTGMNFRSSNMSWLDPFLHSRRINLYSLTCAHYSYMICFLHISTCQKKLNYLCECQCRCCWGHFSSCGVDRATRWKSLGSASRWRQCQQ